MLTVVVSARFFKLCWSSPHFFKNRFHLDSIKFILPNQQRHFSVLILLNFSATINTGSLPMLVEMLISLSSYLASYYSFFGAGLTSVLSSRFSYSAVFVAYLFIWISDRYLKLISPKKRLLIPTLHTPQPPFSQYSHLSEWYHHLSNT